MEKINLKLENIHKMAKSLQKAISRLNKTKDQDDVEFIQDSVAARFKILVESLWKTIKLHLENEKFADVPASPKGVIYFAREIHFLFPQEYDQLLKCLTLRNLASHLYDKPHYLLVIDAAPDALILIEKIVARIEAFYTNSSN